MVAMGAAIQTEPRGKVSEQDRPAGGLARQESVRGVETPGDQGKSRTEVLREEVPGSCREPGSRGTGAEQRGKKGRGWGWWSPEGFAGATVWLS